MSFHNLSRALGYDIKGERVLVPWHECQKIYNQITGTTTPAKDGANLGPHPALTGYKSWTEKTKAFWGKVIQEGLCRAQYLEIMVELREAGMNQAAKNLKRCELKEEERCRRRKLWSEVVPGKLFTL